MERTFAEFAGGCVAGMAQAVVGHPFDTIKVRLQSSPAAEFTGPLDCLMKTLRHEGVRGLFKGLSPPFFGMGVMNAALFGINGRMKAIVASVRGKESVADLSLMEVIVAAWMSAPLYTAFVCPVDTVKNSLQYQSHGKEQLYNGPIHCIRELGPRGLMRGYLATVMMRTVGLPAYFASYEGAKRWMTRNEAEGATPSSSSVLVAGGVAGTAFWAASFPFDTVKTRLQIARGKGVSDGTFAAARYVYQHEGGIRGFYRGFIPCILRSMPANAAAFWGYETVMAVLGYGGET